MNEKKLNEYSLRSEFRVGWFEEGSLAIGGASGAGAVSHNKSKSLLWETALTGKKPARSA